MSWLVALLACRGSLEQAPRDGGASTDGGSVAGDWCTSDTGERFSPISWGEDQVELCIENGTGEYQFGMVDTDVQVEDPWTGEDCHLGDTLGDGALVSWCHPAFVGLNQYHFGGNPADLDVATQTAFTGREFEDTVTYYVGQGNDCWVWGHDTTWYLGRDCIEI